MEIQLLDYWSKRPVSGVTRLRKRSRQGPTTQNFLGKPQSVLCPDSLESHWKVWGRRLET